MKNENHCAIIAKISVIPHPNPEVHSLAVGTCLSETLIVSKSTSDGDIGIYFPCDLQISERFAQSNDLLRRKNLETGKAEGGMFDANRKVRAQTFKGIKSYGFWAPLSYLSKCGVDVTKLKEGDLIDTVGDIEICCKYESPEQKKAKIREQKKMTMMQKIKARIFAKEKAVTLFPEHKDTSHFLRNLHHFKVGDEIIISEKMEGCVHADTIVDTLNDGLQTIKTLVDNKSPTYIKGRDLETQEDVYTLVENFFFVENDGEWYEIELEDGRKITITGNNPVFLPELNVYRRVDELIIGDVCFVE